MKSNHLVFDQQVPDSKPTQWPIISEDDFLAVRRVLESGVLVNGPEASALEQDWAEFLGIRCSVAVSSCTHAIHAALLALGIKAGDEVLVPALTYCGSVSPIIRCGAVPVFVDVLPGTYEMSPSDAQSKRTPQTAAAIPVHLHGMPCDVRALAAELPDLPIIEDACQAHGATINGEFAGTIGDIGCFSLNQVKPLMGGQGGLVVTSSEELEQRIRLHASPGGGNVVGCSYGITEMAAALARSQLQRLHAVNKIATRNATLLAELLCDHNELLPLRPNNRMSTWHKFRLHLPSPIPPSQFIAQLKVLNVPCENWPGSLVPDRLEYAGLFTPTPLPASRRVIDHSIVIGTEQYPLAVQSQATVEIWGRTIDTMLRNQSNG